MANPGREVSLTDRHRRFVDTQVEEGRHASASEVVSEALRRYETDIAAESAAIAALQAIADRSEAGEGIGDFIDIENDNHLRRVIEDALADAVAKVRNDSMLGNAASSASLRSDIKSPECRDRDRQGPAPPPLSGRPPGRRCAADPVSRR